ncbi:MAG: hypothetical protein IKZ04_01595 [Spirochaetaceae bacterium]|nr:hypothetical protein [Spirochaetaceae bacterium]
MNNKNDYEDILDLIWPQGKITSKMPLQSRAKIFLPFSALKGFEQEIEKRKIKWEKENCK